MPTDSMSVALRLSDTSRAQLDLLMERWGVQMAEAIRRAIWLAWKDEVCDEPQPATPPSVATSQ